MLFPILVVLGVIFGVQHDALAQQREMLEFFGGIIRSGISAAIQADWEKLPSQEIACVDEGLRRRGSSVNDLLRQNVSPSDPAVSGIRSGCRNQQNSSGPSFDCRRASAADEIAICSDAELARLDRLIGTAYEDLRTKIGNDNARAVAGPSLSVRRSCGADTRCIKAAQYSTLRAFQQKGATVPNVEPSNAANDTQNLPPQSPYVVDGLRLGGAVTIGSPTYLAYNCSPSEQFNGMTWCQRKRQESGSKGSFTSSTTIVHSEAGTASYINRYVEPAFFAPNEVIEAVRRLATRFGEPRYAAVPTTLNAPQTVLAYWGDVVLEPLDRARVAELAAGREIRAGILLDHIGNFQRSASTGLPIYRLSGGPGYVWSASWDSSGRGTLRFLTIDASKLAPFLPLNPTTADPKSSSSASIQPVTPPVIPNEQTTTQSPNPAELNNKGTDQDQAPGLSHEVSRVEEPPSAFAQSNKNSGREETTSQQSSSSTRVPNDPPAKPRAEPGSQTLSPTVAAPAPNSNNPSQLPASTTQPDVPSALLAENSVSPRLVGPPIAIQPVSSEKTNFLQTALIATILLLLTILGFLFFQRKMRTALPKNEVSNEPASGRDTEHGKIVEVIASPNETKTPQEPKEIATIELPIALESSSTEMNSHTDRTKIDSSDIATVANVQKAPSLIENKHFGVGVLIGLVLLSALTSPSIGIAGLIPLALAIYLLPSIIAFKVRHHYAWVLLLCNVAFGFTVLGWMGFLVWALTGPRESVLDAMSQHTGLRLSKAPDNNTIAISDRDLRSGWKMPILQAEIFSFKHGAPVENTNSVAAFFNNPVIGVQRQNRDASVPETLRYNASTDIRCVAQIAAETKLRVGRTIGRTALTGIGTAILTGRRDGLGAAFLDYRFAGDETDELVTALVVLSDYSSIVIQSSSEEFEKFISLLPPHVFSDEAQSKTAEEIDRIKRMAADGHRVIDEMKQQIRATEESVAEFGERAKNGISFSDRDQGRLDLSQAEQRLTGERAVLNAVERLIKLNKNPSGSSRRIA